MTVIRKTLLGLLFGTATYAAFSIAVFISPLITTSVDPNLGQPQCPGGKDWDLPGSSCHNGVIADFGLPPEPIPTLAGDAMARRNRRGR
jgi:hypothetical protein